MILLLPIAQYLLIQKISVQADQNVIHVPSESARTIQAAIDIALPGGTIYVHNGTYYEDIVVNKSVALIGDGMEATAIYGHGGIYMISIVADNVTVKGFSIKSNSTNPIVSGILIASSGNAISDNKVINNYNGILLYSSGKNVISDNVILGNDVGLNLYFSSDNTFSSNTVSNNEGGLSLYFSSDNVFSGNTVSNNKKGLSLTFSSKDNIFYHNNFMDSVEESSDSTNYWSYGGEGNRWPDYSGKDLDDNGIGDTLYPVGANDHDSYPLMGAFYDFSVSTKDETYHVTMICNSSLSALEFEVGRETGNKMIHFNVSGEVDNVGFSRIIIPNRLMAPPFIVVTGEEEITPTYLSASDESKTYLYFTYVLECRTITVISSTILRLYYELLDKCQMLQADLDSLNITYNNLLSNYTSSLQGELYSLNSTFTDLLRNFTSSLLANLYDLNITYNDLLNSYVALHNNYDQLQQSYQTLNASVQEHRSDLFQDSQNLRSLVYIFAATTGLLLIITVYLSKRVHGKSYEQE